jgi:chitinase
MKKFDKRKLLIAALIICSVLGVKAQRIIGYMPSWTGSATDIQYGKLTCINYAFVVPNASGDGSLGAIDNVAKLQQIVSLAHASGVKVCIAIGGWSDLNNPGFNTISATTGGRSNFANNLLSLCNQYGLDGVDIDWEYPQDHVSDYASMMQALGTTMHNNGKILTAAVPGGDYYGQYVTSAVFSAVDYLNIMAYDGDSGAGHSPYSFAVSALNYWTGKGLPASKAVLGVPFYARPSWKTFSDLLASGADPNADYFNGDYYNGLITIKQKSQLAKSYGGIMIWQIAGDVSGSNSLLSAIKGVIGGDGGITGKATFYKDCSYGGYAVGLNEGNYTMSQLIANGISDDDISSLKVSAGYKVILYWDDNFGGSSLTKTADDDCLVDDGWNDKVTSLSVQSANTQIAFVEAENYNNMSGIQTEACTEGTLNVGYIDAGDWMAYYNITFPAQGTYTIQYRVSSPSGGTLSCDLNAGSIQLGNAVIPATGDWQSWTTVSQTVSIPAAGTYNFGIYAQTGGWNINWFSITQGLKSAKTNDQAASANSTAQVNIFPNPLKNKIMHMELSGFDNEITRLIIYSLSGRPVLQTSVSSSADVDLTNLPAGVYIVKIGNNISKIITLF